MKITLSAVFCALLLLTGCSGKSLELSVPPAKEGLANSDNFAWWSRAAMDSFMRWSVWRGNKSGYITLFARDGVAVHSSAVGWKDIENGERLGVDTHVRIASMTKPITAVTAMTLVEEGLLSLDDSVAQYLPEFATLNVGTSETPAGDGSYITRPAQVQLKIRHLLMFASGIGPGMNKDSALVRYWDANGIYQQPAGTLRERVSALAELPLFEEPGTRWRYGYSADVLAAVIEVVTGQLIGDAMRERVFIPLGMQDTRFMEPNDDHSALATVYTQDENGDLVKSVPRSYRGWHPGGGGLVSTAADYMRFALMLWNNGEYRGTRILRVDTLTQMQQLHVPDGVLADADIEGIGWGLGMAVVADEEASLTPDRTGDFWWSGYFGTTFVVSPSTGMVAVILTQNEPGEFSGLPYEVYVLQGLALAGM
ncbi:MAG: CubicO group peptidase (beta-lactamase class C family) [Bacteroidia bacterium]|jgi:CubicO group peptidase (beta-lactamase class C family)